ncbi:hypothetical protein [Sphingobacterium mizutaii]|uniref:hypothetical protein n=1 Tax=Sphingobacterium mizutaii TaxID=1010 RepID=UPI000B82085C|nr:hypothetical protein [Sphingobacterium mizutaii]
MLPKDHPIKRDGLLKDIPDNKAFFSCVDDCAKSHLKWAEAFWLLLGSKSNNTIGVTELLRRFGYFWASKVT